MLTLCELEKCRRYIETHSIEKEINNRIFPADPCIGTMILEKFPAYFKD